MGTIATRVDEKVERFISDIMNTEGLDKSSTIRKLLEAGITIGDWRGPSMPCGPGKPPSQRPQR